MPCLKIFSTKVINSIGGIDGVAFELLVKANLYPMTDTDLFERDIVLQEFDLCDQANIFSLGLSSTK